MEHFIRGLGFLLIPVIVSGVLAFLRQPKKAEKGKVYLPKFFAALGLIACTAFVVPTIITAFSDEPLWVPIGFFALSLFCSSLIVAFINCRVSYDEDGFAAKNFFGIKRKFTYDQVTAIKQNMHETYVYVGRHRVAVDEFSIGGSEFIAFVKKKYRASHNGRALPKIAKAKHDIFNGNVDDVFGFMFAYIIVSVMIVGMAIFLTWYIYFNPSTPDNTLKQQTAFESCVMNGDEMVLTSSDDRLYKIRFIGEGLSAQEIRAVCDGKTVVTTYSKEVTPDDEEDYYSVKAMLNGDTYILSFDQTNAWHTEEYWPLILFPIVMALIWGAYVTGSVIVGRNPKKFSKKVIKIFFQDGYVKY